MSFTYDTSDGQSGTGSASTITRSLAGVDAGDLTVVGVSWEGLTTTVTCSDGTTSLTQDPAGIESHASGEPHSVMFYLLASVATGTVTYTVTFGAARTFRNIVAFGYTPSAPCSFVASANSQGEGTAVSSGNISAVGTDGVAFGFYGNYGAVIIDTDPFVTINSVTRDEFQIAGGAGAQLSYGWAKTYSEPFTGAAQGTLDGSNRWTAHIMAFKIGAVGRYNSSHRRQRR